MKHLFRSTLSMQTFFRRLTQIDHKSILDLAVAVGLALVLAYFAFLRPFVPWDSWAYHFPFSVNLLSIYGGAQFFPVCGLMLPRYEGFPLLGNFLQGILWVSFNRIGATTLLNAAGLMLVLFMAHRTLQIRYLTVLLVLFSVPMVAIHFFSTYLDLFAAFVLGAMFLALHQRLRNPGEASLGSFMLIVGLGFIAGGLKYQSIMAGNMILLVFLVVHVVRDGSIPSWRVMGLFLLAGIAVNHWLFWNLVIHGNPFYPIALSVAGFAFPGPEGVYSNYPGYWEHNIRPLNFVLSFTEIDWALRGVEYTYSIDQSSGERSLRFQPARTGGFGVIFAFSSLLLSLVAFVYRRRLSRDTKWLAASALLLILAISFLPMSHELRYWLVVPVVLAAVMVKVGSELVSGRLVLSVAVLMLTLSAPFYVPYIESVGASFPQVERSPPESGYVVREVDDLRDFRFSYAVTGENVRFVCPVGKE